MLAPIMGMDVCMVITPFQFAQDCGVCMSSVWAISIIPGLTI